MSKTAKHIISWAVILAVLIVGWEYSLGRYWPISIGGFKFRDVIYTQKFFVLFLILGIIAASLNALKGLRTGKLRMPRGGIYDRSEEPVMFWIAFASRLAYAGLFGLVLSWVLQSH